MKLPAYSLHSITPIRPPSPLSGEAGNLTNAPITPVRCKLILQNPTLLKDSPTLKLVKDAIAKISMEDPHLATLPVNVLSTGNSSRDPSSSFCYI